MDRIAHRNVTCPPYNQAMKWRPSRDEKSVMRNEWSAADQAILPCAVPGAALEFGKRQRSSGKNLIVLPPFIEQYISPSRFDVL
jgi:hypothetical protein